MESRMQGDLHVRFGGRLWETYHRKVVRRPLPSLHFDRDVLIVRSNYSSGNGVKKTASVSSLAPDIEAIKIISSSDKVMFDSDVESVKTLRINIATWPKGDYIAIITDSGKQSETIPFSL